ncbi:MAG: hypothetical protein R3A80_00495 [Bdellovibrionota bacterium]
MEPLSPKLQKSCERLLLIFYASFVLIPLGLTLQRYLLDFDFSLLSPLFLWVLIKSVFFALLQATMSVLSVAVFSFFLVAYLAQKKLSPLASKFFAASGFLGFSLSPTLVTLSLIFTLTRFTGQSPSGLWAIVLCHFLMNAAYFSSQFYARATRFFANEGKDLHLYLQSLGAGYLSLKRDLLWPLFKNDLKSWFPQVFLWCFMSFAPIVLLSAGPWQNTPELLLYYSLLNDPSGTRLILIFILTATLSFLLTRFASAKSSVTSTENFAAPREGHPETPATLILFITSLLLLLPFLYSLFSPLFSPSHGKASLLGSELLYSLVPTLIVFAFTFLLSTLFGVLSLLCSKELKAISFCNFISAPMVLLGFFSFETQSPFSKYFLIALGSYLALVPWAHRRVRSFADALPAENKNLCLSLGLRNFSYFRFYLWPEIGPSILLLSLLFSLWSLGEYTFSKALLERNSTLALFIEEKLRRYQFDEASLALSITLALSVIVVTPLLWKGRRNAAL